MSDSGYALLVTFSSPEQDSKHKILYLQSQEEWEPRLLLLEAAWASLNSNGEIDHALAIMCISTTLEQMFGIGKEQNDDDPFEFVAYENDPFEMGSRAVAMSSGRAIELME